MGVCPRGAQLRRTKGAISSPLSLMKTTWAFSRVAFFYPRPGLLNPTSNGRFVSFAGSSLGLLRCLPIERSSRPR
jgi:hypothetical protein